MNKISYKDLFYIIIAINIIIFSYLFFDKIFITFQGDSSITPRLFMVTLGAIITVSIMTVMMKLQANQNKEKEFLSQLFDKKITTYSKLLRLILEADDDNIIDKKEINDIENLVGEACLLARKETAEVLAQFVSQLKIYGQIYFRNLTKDQKEDFSNLIKEERQKPLQNSILTSYKYHLTSTSNEEEYFVSLDEVIQTMRNGLDVIEGDISSVVENFILSPYNGRNVIKT